jgi:transposase
MSTSVLYHAFQISGVKYKSTSYEGSAVIFHAETTAEYRVCPHCRSRDIACKGQKERQFHLPPMGEKNAF